MGITMLTIDIDAEHAPTRRPRFISIQRVRTSCYVSCTFFGPRNWVRELGRLLFNLSLNCVVAKPLTNLFGEAWPVGPANYQVDDCVSFSFYGRYLGY